MGLALVLLNNNLFMVVMFLSRILGYSITQENAYNSRFDVFVVVYIILRAMTQSYDCSCVIEANVKNMGKCVISLQRNKLTT